MKTDIKDTDQGYEITMNLPGVKKEDVKAELKDGYLTISAAKGLDQDEQEKKTGRYIRRERYAGACERSFYVGEDVTEKDIQAGFKDGLLKIIINRPRPKEVTDERRYIPIL